MKRIFILINAVIVAIMSMFLLSCSNVNNQNYTEDEIRSIYNMYVVYAENNDDEPMSYEDWLLSIKGEDGQSPKIEISNDGYWIINGEKTNFIAIGQDGEDGQSPTVEISNDGYWIINGEKTNFIAIGQDGEDGQSPTVEISNDGYWIINGEKTNFLAIGQKGDPGVGVLSSYINDDGELIIILTNSQEVNAGKIPIVNNSSEISLEYKLLEDCSYEIVGIGNFTGKKLIVPDSYNYAPVTSISNNAFENSSLEYVEISKNIVNIGSKAFYNSNKLDTIIFERDSKLTTIGERAFQGIAIDEIVIPSSVKSIGKFAFSLETLQNLYFMNGGTEGLYIEYGAFISTRIAHLTLPKRLEFLGERAFAYNTMLTEVIFEKDTNNLTVDENVFEQCSKFSKLYWMGSIEEFASINYISSLYNMLSINLMEETVQLFVNNQEVIDVDISNNIQKIKPGVFAWAKSIESVSITNDIEIIDKYAFFDCDNLNSITIGSAVTQIGECAFAGCESIVEVFYESSKNNWNNIDVNAGNDYLTEATIYYYSDNPPTEDGNYWHYIDNTPVLWT